MASDNTEGKSGNAVRELPIRKHKKTKHNKQSHFHASGFFRGKQSAIFNGVEITFMIYLFVMQLSVLVLGSGPLTLRSKTQTIELRTVGFFCTA